MAPAAKRSLIVAVIGSFAVYLLPVVTPHVTTLFGTVLWAELSRGGEARGFAWLAANLALAICLQAAAGAIIYWAVRRVSLIRVLALAATIPVFFYAMSIGYLMAIPTFFLIEREARDAHGDWPVACSVPGAELAADSGGPDAPLLGAGEAWLIKRGTEPNTHSLALLASASCVTRDLGIDLFRTTVRQTIPGGGALYAVLDRGANQPRLMVRAPGGAVHALAPPAGVKYWQPVLSADGARIAWLERGRRDARPRVHWLIKVRPVDGARVERTIVVKMVRPASLRLIGFDADNARFLVRQNERRFALVDASGGLRPLAEAPKAPAHPTHRLLRLKAGWVSWDVYRDEGRSRLAWHLNGREGLHEVPKGRGINAVSVSPDGRMIAVSVGPNLRIGSVKDAVYVIRAADGTELYRRFLSAYSRSQPAFLGNRRLAYTDTSGAEPVVRVLEVPEKLAAP